MSARISTASTRRICVKFEIKAKNYTIAGLDSSLNLQGVEALRISRRSTHEGGKFVSPTHRPRLHPGYIPGSGRVSRHQEGLSLKNPNGSIRNRTRDLPARSAVPQPTAPQLAPWYWGLLRKHVEKIQIWLISGEIIGYFIWRPNYVLLLSEALDGH